MKQFSLLKQMAEYFYWGPSLLGAEFVRGRVCQGPSLSGAEMSRNLWASWACVITMHSIRDIQVPPVPIQPKTFRFPQRSLDLRILSKEAFSRSGSTVVTMKLSCYTYQSQNLDEACILNGCSNWNDPRLSVCISFRKHDSLKYHQGSVLKVLC